MARVVQDFGEQRLMRGPENRIAYVYVYRLDCGCSMEVDRQRVYQDRRDSLMDLVERAAAAHLCGIVFTPKVYEVVRGDASQRYSDNMTLESLWPLARAPTYMGVPIFSGPVSGAERTMREFYSEVRAPAREPTWPFAGAPHRPATNPLGFTPEQLRGLSATSIIVDEVASLPEVKKPEAKPDRFDLIEID